MSFFKNSEAWLKDALNKVETQLDKAFEMPKEPTSNSTMKRSKSSESISGISEQGSTGVSKSTIRDLSEGSSIHTLYKPVKPVAASSHSFRSNTSSPDLVDPPSEPPIDPASIPLPSDSPVSPQIDPSTPYPSISDAHPVSLEEKNDAIHSNQALEIKSFGQETQHVPYDLHRARETIKKLLVKTKLLEDKIRELEKNKEGMLEMKKNEIKAFKLETEYWKKQVSDMEEKHQKDQARETEPYRIALEAELKKFVQLETSFENTKRELSTCRLQLEKSQLQCSTKETEHHQTLTQLHTEIERYRSQAQEMQKKFDSTFQKTTLELTRQLQRTESNLKFSEEALMEREENLISQLENSKRESMDLQTSLKKIRSEHLISMESLNDLEKKYAELQEAYTQLEACNKELKNKCQVLSSIEQRPVLKEKTVEIASQTDISTFTSEFSPSIISETTSPPRVYSDSFSSKENNPKPFENAQNEFTPPITSRKMSLDTVPISPLLTNTLKTQMAVLQTAKEQLTLQVVQYSNENSTLKAQLDEVMKENHQLNDNYQTVLELLGEKEEEIADCRLTLKEAKEAYREQLEILMSNSQKD